MKKIATILLTLTMLISTSGCLKRDNLENIDIYTTSYPIEYITNRLYGKHSTVKSIYPDGIIIDQYELTDKQIKDYSNASLFIFNGLATEKNYVAPIFEYNQKIKIIDTTLSMDYENYIEELWLNPSNFLMLAQNIKIGFNEYINNHYLKNDIEEKYEELKVEVSNLDAKIKLMVESSTNKTIVVADDLFKFLEDKYGLTVISLEENDNLTDKTKADVVNLITSGEISYIFTTQNREVNETVNEIKNATNVELVELKTISNLTEEERKNKDDYFTLMNYNIELLKQELYD
ncbi:MAG: zinc ABC transporter substrate-binding protein [Bacilli bacterium]|nr:zinc ABC transporter substrate-binding protein [Bacilli bacterium]